MRWTIVVLEGEKWFNAKAVLLDVATVGRPFSVSSLFSYLLFSYRIDVYAFKVLPFYRGRIKEIRIFLEIDFAKRVVYCLFRSLR